MCYYEINELFHISYRVVPMLAEIWANLREISLHRPGSNVSIGGEQRQLGFILGGNFGQHLVCLFHRCAIMYLAQGLMREVQAT